MGQLGEPANQISSTKNLDNSDSDTDSEVSIDFTYSWRIIKGHSHKIIVWNCWVGLQNIKSDPINTDNAGNRIDLDDGEYHTLCRAYTVLFKKAYRGIECGLYTVFWEIVNNYLCHAKEKICVFLEVPTGFKKGLS
jgi:hypothetical protein